MSRQNKKTAVKGHRWPGRWRKAAGALACVVALGTVCALIQPAAALENNALCGNEGHTHTEACYPSPRVESERPLEQEGLLTVQKMEDGDQESSTPSGEAKPAESASVSGTDGGQTTEAASSETAVTENPSQESSSAESTGTEGAGETESVPGATEGSTEETGTEETVTQGTIPEETTAGETVTEETVTEETATEETMTEDSLTEELPGEGKPDLRFNGVEGNFDGVAYIEKTGAAARRSRSARTAGEPLDVEDYIRNDNRGVIVKWHEAHTDAETYPWKDLPADGSTIPADAHLRVEVKYFEVDPVDLKNAGYMMTFAPDNKIKDLLADGKIKVNGVERGIIKAEEEKITLQFDSDWVDTIIKASGKHSIAGTFYFQGELDLSKLEGENGNKLTLGPVEIVIPLEKDASAQYGKISLDKKVPELVKDEEGNYYLQYELNVKTDEYGMPEVKVRDFLTASVYLPESPYVGVETEEKEIIANSPQVGPVEKIENADNEGPAGKIKRITGENGKKGMEWNIGSMKAYETRTLTYWVRLTDSYIGIRHDDSTAIVNSAAVTSKGYPHGTDDAKYNPDATANIKKEETEVKLEDGKYVIQYTIKVSAPEENDYIMTNLKVYDRLIDTTPSSFPSEYWDKVAYVENSFQLFDSQEKEIGFDQTLNTPNPSIGKNGGNSKCPYFDIWIGDLAPGESKTIKYQMTLKADAVALANNVGIYNRASVYDDGKKEGGNKHLGSSDVIVKPDAQVWLRKLGGTKVTANTTVSIAKDNIVYEYAEDKENLREIEANKPSGFEVTAGAFAYTVVVNEKGQWDVSSAVMKDTLGDGLVFTGYVQIDVYDRLENLPDGAKDEVVIEKIKGIKPEKTVWVNVDNLKGFSLSGEKLHFDANDGKTYVLKYYAVPDPEISGMDTVRVINTFELNGEGIGPDGTTKILLSGIEASKTVSVIMSDSFTPSKQFWYYDPDDKDFSYINSEGKTVYPGALYWVIRINGSMIRKNSYFEESVNGYKEFNNILRGDKNNPLESKSFIGFYVGDLEENEKMGDVYSSVDEMLESGRFSQIPLEYYTLTVRLEWSVDNTGCYGENVPEGARGENHDLRITMDKDFAIETGKSLYYIVKTEPYRLPDEDGEPNNKQYNNKVNVKNASDKGWVSYSAKTTLWGGTRGLDKIAGSVFKAKDDGTVFEQFIVSDTATGKGSFAKVDTTVTNAELQSRYLCVDEKFQYISEWEGQTGYKYKDGTYVTWQVAVNGTKQLNGTYSLIDTLPDGLELSYVRAYYIRNVGTGLDAEEYKYNRENEENWWGDSKKNTPETVFAASNNQLVSEGWKEHRTMSSMYGEKQLGWNRAGIYYYTKNNQIQLYFPNLVEGHDPITFQIVCRVTNPDIYFEDVEFYNTASLYDRNGNEIDVQSAPVTVRNSALSKEELTELGENGKLETTVLPYRITVNEDGTDMEQDKDAISVPLIDSMSANLSIDINTLRIYKNMETEENLIYSGEKSGDQVIGNISSNTKIRISVEDNYDDSGAADGSKKILFYNLPDSMKLIITYCVNATLASGKENSYSNKAYWEGYEESSNGETSRNNMVYEAGATASTTQHGGIKITKYDGNDTSKRLAGAEFVLLSAKYVEATEGMCINDKGVSLTGYPGVYDGDGKEVKVERNDAGLIRRYYIEGEWQSNPTGMDKFHHKLDTDEMGNLQLDAKYDSNGKLIVGEEGSRPGYVLGVMTTDSKGEASFGLSESEDKIHFNKIYAVVETKAPAGYGLDRTAHFFVVPNEDESGRGANYFYHSDWPTGVHQVRLTEKEYLTYFLDVYDYKCTAQVTKDFAGNRGIANYIPGTYKFGIWKEKDIIDGVPWQMEDMLQQVQITYSAEDFGYYWEKDGEIITSPTKPVGEISNLQYGILPGHLKTATFTSLEPNGVYYIYELSQDNYAIPGSGSGTINGNTFVVSYSTKQENSSGIVGENKVIPNENEVPSVLTVNYSYGIDVTKNFEDSGGKELVKGIAGTYTFGLWKTDSSGLETVTGKPLQIQTVKWDISDPEQKKTISFDNLEMGSYAVYELNEAGTPVVNKGGFSLNGNTFMVGYATGIETEEAVPGNTVTLRPDSEQTPTVYVTNKATVTLPETGGRGTNLFETGGILLMAVSLMYGYWLKHRRERRLK